MMKTKKVCGCFSPPIFAETRKKNKKKSAHPLVHPWPKILRRKEEER